ncbi:MAG TPA: hypothetical protein VHI11_05765 [Jiangellaceae bacterium]|jgi:hypothetical protein|nr:hypothetical protein [Jiangellaceae bacterium]
MTGRPDVVIVHGNAAVVLSGDKASELLDLVGVVKSPTFIGWQCPADDLPKLRAAALTRGWQLVEHEPRPTP